MLAMIVFMALVMISKCIYHSFNAYNAKHTTFWDDNQVLFNILSFLPNDMLSIACSINVRNWMYYFIKIKEAAYARKRLEEYDEHNDQKLASFHKRTKVLLIELRIGITVFFVLTGLSLVSLIYISCT